MLLAPLVAGYGGKAYERGEYKEEEIKEDVSSYSETPQQASTLAAPFAPAASISSNFNTVKVGRPILKRKGRRDPWSDSDDSDDSDFSLADEEGGSSRARGRPPSRQRGEEPTVYKDNSGAWQRRIEVGEKVSGEDVFLKDRPAVWTHFFMTSTPSTFILVSNAIHTTSFATPYPRRSWDTRFALAALARHPPVV